MLLLETYPFDKFEELLDTFLEACHCGGVLHSAHHKKYNISSSDVDSWAQPSWKLRYVSGWKYLKSYKLHAMSPGAGWYELCPPSPGTEVRSAARRGGAARQQRR